MVVLRCLFWGDSLHNMFAGGFQNGSTKKYQNSLLLFSKIRLATTESFVRAMSSVPWGYICIYIYTYIIYVDYERIRHIYCCTCNLPFELPKNHQIKQKPCGLKKASLSPRWKGFWSGSRSVLNGFFTAWQSPFRGLKKEELSRMTDHAIGAMDIYKIDQLATPKAQGSVVLSNKTLFPIDSRPFDFFYKDTPK